jgi:hypothetical protein
MQFPPGVEMASLLTGESVCLCNGGKGRGRAGFLIFRCRRPGAGVTVSFQGMNFVM